MSESRQIQDGETVEGGPEDSITLKWSASGSIHHIEIFPVPIGNMGSKHVLYQPEATWGEMSFTPLTSGDIFGVAYTDAHTKYKGAYVFHVKVKGSNGFLYSFMAASGGGSRRWAGDEMEVDIGEPVNFYWKASPTAKHGNLTGVGKIEPGAGKATVIVKESADYTINMDGGGSEKDTQTIKIKCSGKPYEGYYDDTAKDLIANNVL